jgi:hypothetical protein
MKLLKEIVEDVHVIEEAKEDGKKHLFIEGVFMQYDIKNKNGRTYPKSVMEAEVKRYVEEKVKHGRAFGELTHPNSPQIDLNNVSHVIKSLKFESNGRVIGKAQIIEEGKGLIARGLIAAGANLGVSSRALGSLKQIADGTMEVQEDFHLVTPADIVSDPSAPDAFVQGIMENCEWFFDEEKGAYIAEKSYEQKKILSSLSVKQIEEHKLRLFENWIKSL